MGSVRVFIQSDSGRLYVKRYRLMSFRRPLAPWRATLREAQDDALAQGVASRDSMATFITVPAWICISDPNEETEAGLRPRRTRRQLQEVTDTSRAPRRWDKASAASSTSTAPPNPRGSRADG